MAEQSCRHLGAAPVGYTQAPVQRADAAVAGLVLFTGLYTCPDCAALVVGAYLHPRGAGAVLTSGFTELRTPADARRPVGEVS